MSLALALAAGLGRAAGGDPGKAGAYCALPAPGEKPSCLAPAEAEYGDFFAALEDGELDSAAAARVEQDLRATVATPRAYLALSSVAYGYWRLARQAAEMEEVDPQLRRQLDQWNALLGAAYEQSDADPAFRDALRLAASDLHQKSPEGLHCLDESGTPSRCRPTEGLIASIDSLDEQLGMRGALRRVLRRVFDSQDESEEGSP